MTRQYPSPCAIVIADSGDTSGRLQDMLGAEGQLQRVTTLGSAQQVVDGATSLVICDCHFDEGRLYELLRWMRAQPALQATPFLAIRLTEGGLDDAMYESVKIATQALGGSGFVDLYRWEQRYGRQQAAARLVEQVRALCSGAPTDLDAGA
jgi:CheY-like chemotaxis protein